MKKIMLFLLVILITTISCTVQQYGMLTGNAVLSNNNYTIKGNVNGSATLTQFLGLGGYDKKGLVEQAKNNVFIKYDIKSNQALANITVDIQKTNFLFIVYTTKVNITADVVEYNLSTPIIKYPLNELEIKADYLKTNPKNIEATYNIGDDVSFEDEISSKNITGKIIELGGNKAVVEFLKKNGDKKTKKIPLKELKKKQ